MVSCFYAVDAPTEYLLRVPGLHPLTSSCNSFPKFRLNTCPYQGSRTIRTEEAVLISLATLSTSIAKASYDQLQHIQGQDDAAEVEFSDESPSDESSASSGDKNDESSSNESDSSDD